MPAPIRPNEPGVAGTSVPAPIRPNEPGAAGTGLPAPIRPKLAIFSPMPPKENGIADYAYELLPFHAADFDVTLVLEDEHPSPALGKCSSLVKTIFLTEYLARRREYAEHIHLYHLGNNPDHVYMLPVVMEQPGVIVLHDASLHYLADCATLRHGDRAGYNGLLQREYGSVGAFLAGQFEARGWRERAMFYELPMTRTLLNRAKAVVAHSAFAYFKAKAQNPAILAKLIPHHLTPSVARADARDRKLAREALGLEEDELVLLSLGFITKAKQIESVFRVLQRIRDQLPPFRYVLAGAKLPEQFDVDTEISLHGLDDVVTVTDYLDEDAFFDYIVASDLVINLRYPTGGETSGTLIRALGCGSCIVVVDHGPFAEIPDDICIKVPWTPRFDRQLEESLLAMIHHPARRKEIGDRARKFMRDRHAIDKSAASYREFLLEASALPETPWGVERPHRFLGFQATERMLAETGAPPAGALWVRESVLPEAQNDRDRLLLAGNHPAIQLPWLERLGYGDGQIDVIAPEALAEGLDTTPRSLYQALLVDNRASQDAWRKQLASLNQALAFGGILVVDLVQGDPAENDLLAEPSRIDGLLAEAGFRVHGNTLGGAGDVSLAVDFRGAMPDGECFEACWQAVKISEYMAPRPESAGQPPL